MTFFQYMTQVLKWWLTVLVNTVPPRNKGVRVPFSELCRKYEIQNTLEYTDFPTRLDHWNGDTKHVNSLYLFSHQEIFLNIRGEAPKNFYYSNLFIDTGIYNIRLCWWRNRRFWQYLVYKKFKLWVKKNSYFLNI